ncbi:MAG: hypothetical protein P8N24_01675 [Hellea sp.]|nr:hypothetical protein [Hellea sp.]
MSGWWKKDNYLFYAHGKSGSTSLSEGNFKSIFITDDNDSSNMLSYYNSNPDTQFVVFIRNPLDRWLSGIWQFSTEVIRKVNPRTDVTNMDKLAMLELFCEILNYNKPLTGPVFNDAESYHMDNFLERFDNVEIPFMVVETKNMTPFMKRIGIDLGNHNANLAKVEAGNGYADVFQSCKYRDAVLQWLEPEMARFTKLILDKG